MKIEEKIKLENTLQNIGKNNSVKIILTGTDVVTPVDGVLVIVAWLFLTTMNMTSGWLVASSNAQA
jgi:hypothetical protein